MPGISRTTFLLLLFEIWSVTLASSSSVETTPAASWVFSSSNVSTPSLSSLSSSEVFTPASPASLSSSSSSSSLSKPSPGVLWEHRPALDNMVTSPTFSFYRRSLRAPTRGSCAMACHRHPWCSSFFYQGGRKSTGTCLLESVALQSAADLGPGKGFRYFAAASDWCDSSQGFVYYPGARFCFRVFTEIVMDWDAARERCRAEGLQLVAPDSGLQMSLLLETVNRTHAFRKKNKYLGVVRPREEWDLPWAGGKPFFVDRHNGSLSSEALQERFWVKNNPNNQKDTQNCVQIDSKRGSMLNDLGCSYNNRFVCQKVWPQ